MRAAALTKPRSSQIAREYIGVTLGISTIGIGIQPGTGRQGNDSWANFVGDPSPSLTGSACVKYPNQVALFYISTLRIGAIH